MKLQAVEINNFRSIKNAVIKFEPSCRILVGINESGKSNILKALKLLNHDYDSNENDVRYQLPDEDEGEDSKSFVDFKLTFESSDIDHIYQQLISNFSFVERDDEVEATFEGISIPLKIWVQDNLPYVNYYINVKDTFKTALLPARSHEYTFNFFSLTEQAYSNRKKIVTNLEKDLPSSDYLFHTFNSVQAYDYESSIHQDTDNVFLRFFNTLVENYVEDNLPSCIYWTSCPENALPSSININEFANNPKLAEPLKNMFNLSQIKNISETIEIEKRKKTGIRNLLERVSKKTTSHIQSVWKEYENIEILLEPNGDLIEIHIRDNVNRYEFESRSDGFKRFLSFLLTVSAQVKTKELTNTLILIDEPEISLHPSGAKYLLDELIKISSENTVIFSTHSIFMVDKNNIGRHIIVSKENEKTITKNANQTNIMEEEVIYNALGYSVFESLKLNNIIFEGWRDYKLYEIAMKNTSPENHDIVTKAPTFGAAFLQGVKDAGRVIPLLELANRQYIILSDDDAPAKEAQSKFIGSGKWLKYSDILPDSIGIISGEDFIKWSAFKSIIDELKSKLNLTDIPDDYYSNNHGKISTLKKWIGSSIKSKPEVETYINQIKDQVHTSLSNADIEENYYLLIRKLIDHFPK